MRRVLLAAALLLGCKRHHGHAWAAPPSAPAESLRDEALAGSKAADHVRSLTDEVGPRLAGSEGDAKAVAWGLAKMKSLGLTHVRAEKVMVPRWVRGVETGAVRAPHAHALTLTALGGSVPTPEGGLEAEVVVVASLEALAALPDASVAGKIVFFDKPMERTKDGLGYSRAVDVRGRGPSAAAKKGAVATLVRSITPSVARLPHTGGLRYADGVPAIPAAALAVPDAMLLRRLADAGPTRVRLVLGCHKEPDAESANVVGEVEGRSAKDEIVLLGAHLDSWDLGTGALDDGAGVGVVLEAGRLLAARPTHPRRTVRVVLFANEENGLRGGVAYAKAHEAELGKHVVALELDLGTDKIFRLDALAAPSADPKLRALSLPLASLGIAGPVKGEHFGSDISPLRAQGVPQIAFAQDATRYFDIHHSADDTFDKIDPKGLDQMVAATVAFAWGAAEMDGDFGRIPPHERGEH
ncbi:MAG: M28 family peptidase [Myxococcales bacterium]|nr:M28 family peptidase [Myxococcales bacterium]